MTEKNKSHALAGKVYLVDTNVFIWAFDPSVVSRGDQRTLESQACLNALRAARAHLVVSVLTLAEAMRKDPAEAVPAFSWPIVVPVAREDVPYIAASRWQIREADGATRVYMKYDTLLVGQAQRLRAAAFISYDRKAHPMAAAAGVDLVSPGELLAQLRGGSEV